MVVCTGSGTGAVGGDRGGSAGSVWDGGGRMDLAGALSFSFHKSLSFGGGDGLMWGAGRLGRRVLV